MVWTLILVIILFLSFFIVIAPLMGEKSPIVQEIKSEPSKKKLLEEERNMYLKAISDIRFDFNAGKLSQEDYESLKKEYLATVVRLDQEIKKLTEGDKKDNKSKYTSE